MKKERNRNENNFKAKERSQRKRAFFTYTLTLTRPKLSIALELRTKFLDPYRVFSAVDAIRNSKRDCNATPALPLTLLPRASSIMGMTSRIFTIDGKGEVWIHYPWKEAHAEKLRESLQEACNNRSTLDILSCGTLPVLAETIVRLVKEALSQTLTTEKGGSIPSMDYGAGVEVEWVGQAS